LDFTNLLALLFVTWQNELAIRRMPMPPRFRFRIHKLHRKLRRAAHVMGPTLIALAFAGVSSGVAHAQGTMGFSGATTLMQTFKTFAIYAGAVICLGGLIFAGIRMMSGRFQATTPNKELGLANRDLGTITEIKDGQISVRMDGKKEHVITFDPSAFRQFDHGYAVTSHSAQGLTAGRVLAHFDTDSSYSLINTRLAYVAISRASDDARVYTNNAETLGQRLATDISKTTALDFRTPTPANEVQQAVAAFRGNDPATGTAKLQEQGRIHEYANPEHRLAAVALAYAGQEDRSVVVAPDPAERRELIGLIRDELRSQGRLAPESHSHLILVEQDFGNPRLVANYAPDDQIHYKAGSPVEHGIPDNSTATVLSVDAHANTLTVATRDGNETSYNPALLKKLTAKSTIYREEQRDMAVGERILFTVSDRDAHMRSGDFATVEKIGEDGTLAVRLDNGKSVELTSDQAHHIDYGYAVDTVPHAAMDRVLVTGDAAQLAEQQEAFARLSPSIRDLAVYTSDGREIGLQKSVPGAEIAPSLNELSSALGNLPSVSTPEVEVQELGIGL
jgi:hypothetical protein